MNRLQLSILVFLLLLASVVSGQSLLSGTVWGDDNGKTSTLPGASVYWLNVPGGTITDESGRFRLETEEPLPQKLVISYVGFQADTVSVSTTDKPLRVKLKATVELDETEVVARQKAVSMSTMETINTTNLSREHLQKAACCNLSESFETDASIDVVENDAVAGTRKILMLGLDGVYSQILFEGIPLIRGLSSTYGLTYIPGTWIESIQVSKGAGSVVNGFESMTGQINLEYWKPEDEQKAFFNAYLNHMGRLEGNGYVRQRLNEKWSTMLLAHGRTSLLAIDNNGDGYMDMPMDNELQLMNRWKYQSERRESVFGVRFLMDNKIGGQTAFNPEINREDQPWFGMRVRTRLVNVFGKSGFMFPETPWKSIGLQASATYHEQDAYFGRRDYLATHTSGYFNGIYQTKIVTTDHTFKTGVSMRIDDYDESFTDSAFARTEYIPGVFAEYAWNHKEKFAAVAGIRADQHNLFGLQVSPRLHMKYNFNPLTVLRFSGGRGFRSPVLFAENISPLASSRQVRVLETPQAEIAWNTGVSFLRKFTIGGMEGSFNIDYFYTWFENQLVSDMDFSARQLLFYNLDGPSYSHSVQADFLIEPVERFEVKTAYKRYEVRTTYLSEGTIDRPFVPRDRALLNLAYSTKYDIWKFDLTTNWFGVSRIPSTEENPEIHQRDTESPSYFMLSGQVTRKFKFGEFYLGGENLLNYRQPNPVIDAQNPFGEFFDAAMVWGPIAGTIVYIGFRTNF
jgi:outer membrane receptor protein involved in Fe transport